MIGRAVVFLVGTLALAGCLTPPKHDGPFAPGVAPGGQAVDGLLVGHRLMDAGEYQLALTAYMRAAGENGMTAQALSSLGSANLRLGRLGQAEDQLREAVELDPDSVPAWNNLGVVLMERGEYGEARRIFRHAYALDSGESDSIRENLRLAIARTEIPDYTEENTNNSFELERRGGGRYLLLRTP